MLVDGAFADKAARMVAPAQNIEIRGDGPRFVSRAGAKLAGALEKFGIDPTGAACLDVGSSTGGFTDCLLQAGATSVVAVDVGTNQLHERIRADDRVVVREQTDVRTLAPDQFDRPLDLIVGDLSFISLRLVLPTLAQLCAPTTGLILLVKPQFEAGRVEAARSRGVITDPAIWRRVIEEVAEAARSVGLELVDLGLSPVRGTSGNVEFLALMRPGLPTICEYGDLIDRVLVEASPPSDRDDRGEQRA